VARRTSAPVVINGRFLRARPTGLHRVARRLVVAARESGLHAEVLAPTGTDDPLADRTSWAPPGRVGQHLWEQAALVAAAGRRPIVSLANTAPLAAAVGIVTVHDLATRVGPQWFRPELRLYGHLVLAAARRARRVVTVSHQVAGELAELGVAFERIRVIPNAVGPEFCPQPEAAVVALRDRLRLRVPYVVMVGWADPRKDVATAVAAHRAVVGTRPHDLVLVGGRHPNFAPVAEPVGAGIRVVGYVPDADLPSLLTGAAALLYPSRYEGFGLPPLEALACGTTALVSDLPAVREATGGAAVYLPPGDGQAWAGALEAALAGTLPAGPAPPRWSWADAGASLAEVVRAVGAG
jgi:glycosyltransferase involved in cell wall biosynthesis